MAPKVELDRLLSPVQFESWRLGTLLAQAEPEINVLPSKVYVPDQAATDYVHARNAALHNHLTSQDRGLYFFLGGGGGGGGLRLCAVHDSSWRSLCTLPLAAPPGGACAEPQLAPTVVEVAERSGAHKEDTCTLLASTGLGDLRLVSKGREGGNECAALSAAAYPLRLRPPLQGARHFQLLAACRLDSGLLVAVLWAARERAGAGAPARCEAFAVALSCPDADDSAAGGAAPRVLSVQLLQRCSVPPFAALCNPVTGGVLVALDPADGGTDADGAAAPAPEAAAAGAHGAAPPASGHLEDGQGGGGASPRTLQAAVAQLAQYTSDEPAAADAPVNQYADMYGETGPDGVGGMGGEPACSLLAFLPTAQLAGVPGGALLLRLVEEVPCWPHRLLGCQQRGAATLLALTDDVDCAVLELRPAAEQAPGSVGAEAGFSACHIASVAALAYVAAGKLQKKFLLPAAAQARVAAALVETRQYCYLYSRTPPAAVREQQQVVELGLGGPGVLGAALLPAAGGEGEGGGRLVVLAEDRLLCFHL